jgi:CheY-like chemotaxis protein
LPSGLVFGNAAEALHILSSRTLIAGDSENDVLMITRELKKSGYHPIYERIETFAAMKKALQEKQWDIILCDYQMPEFSAPSALAFFKEVTSLLSPEVPVKKPTWSACIQALRIT